MPTVSVIIPTYNRADTLGTAVESVLDQTMADLELVVVDDASTDHTDEVVEGYAESDDRVRRVAHEQNRGGSAARNTGIDAATGEYVAFLDSDDVWHPEKLEQQLARIDDGEWIGAYCAVRKDLTGVSRLAGLAADLLDNEASGTEMSGGTELRAPLLTGRLSPRAGSTLIVERSAADRVGGFDTDLPRYQDPEFFFRLLGEGTMAYVDEPLVTLGSAGSPSGDTIDEAADAYLSKHADVVERLEREGHRIEARYELLTAKWYFIEGEFLAGARHLRGAAVSPTELPGVAHSVAAGLTGDRDTGTTSALAAAALATVALAVLFVAHQRN